MNPKALQSISYGVYLIGAGKDSKFNAQIANTVVQVCSEPPMISVCINKQNLTHEYITANKAFTVSILQKETPLNFIGLFGFKSGRAQDKFKDASFKYQVGETGAPVVLDNAVSYMEARLVNQVDVSTHTIFIGQVIAAEIVKPGEAMTYAYYHEVKRGSVPKTAPHYVEEKKEEAAPKLAMYKCKVCGWIYDPAKGNPDGGIAPGTPFEKIPDGWVCPVCGAEKSEFEKI